MPVTDTGNEPTGLNDAAKAFEGLLSADLGDKENHEEHRQDSSEEKQPDENQPEQGEEHQGEDDADPDSKETSEEDEKSDEDAEGEGDAEDEEENADGSSQKPQTITVKIDGKEVEVPLEEAAKGYQRQADYSRKTAALADERRAFETHVEKFKEQETAVVQERGQYAHLLRALEQRLDELTPKEPDWVALAQQVDPAEYQQTRAVWDAIKEQKAAAKAERERVEGEQKATVAKQVQAKLKAGAEKLMAYNETWKDPKKWATDKQAIFDYGVNSLGFTPQEIANAVDPRAIIAVHKAMLYDKLMANKPKPDAASGKGKEASPKPLRAGSAADSRAPASDVTKAKQRLAKSGSVGDAAAVFERLL